MGQSAEIAVERLTKTYGSLVAVNNISFAVPKGEIVGFLGPNGAGKTTTIRVLTCFLPPTSGTARVAGHDVFFDSLAVRRSVGYLSEGNPLYPEMRVEEYLDFKGRLHGMATDVRRKAISRVAERCWLKDRMKSLIGTLSKGYRQRVGIADALLHNPPVLILDEPTVGLDPTQVIEVRKLIAELAGDHTVLLSTHILREAELICQRVLIIAGGRIVAQGTPGELAQQAHRGIFVEVRGPSDQVRAALNALPGIEGVEVDQTGGIARLILRGKTTPEVREQISATVSQRGWSLREMRPEGGSLEEYFVRVTDPANAVPA